MSQKLHYLKELLDSKAALYNKPSFIDSDPIQIPHMFNKKEDIEIAGFLTSIISWGNRNSIIKNAKVLMQLMDHAPHDFIMSDATQKIDVLPFVHRTFNGNDCAFFIRSLHTVYTNYGGLESIFSKGYELNKDIREAIAYGRKIFLKPAHEKRTEKHFADISKNASCKRINMFRRVIKVA